MQEVEITNLNQHRQYGLFIALQRMGETITRVKLEETSNPDKEAIVEDLQKQLEETRVKFEQVNTAQKKEMEKDWTVFGRAEDGFVDVGNPSSAPSSPRQ